MHATSWHERPFDMLCACKGITKACYRPLCITQYQLDVGVRVCVCTAQQHSSPMRECVCSHTSGSILYVCMRAVVVVAIQQPLTAAAADFAAGSVLGRACCCVQLSSRLRASECAVLTPCCHKHTHTHTHTSTHYHNHQQALESECCHRRASCLLLLVHTYVCIQAARLPHTQAASCCFNPQLQTHIV
jgi:hypothetical protein